MFYTVLCELRLIYFSVMVRVSRDRVTGRASDGVGIGFPDVE